MNIEDSMLSSSATSVVVTLFLMIMNEYGPAFDVISIYIKNINNLLLVSPEKRLVIIFVEKIFYM